MANPGGVALKVDLIADAYSQLRISGLTVDPTPEDLDLALKRMENMAAEWFGRNICTDYEFEEEPDPNADSGVQRKYWQAFATNLAVRLIPDFGKTEMPAELKMQATQSLSFLSGQSAMEQMKQVQYPSRQARGSGNTLRYNRWDRFYQLQSEAPISCASKRMIVDDVDNFVEHFEAYLKENETIKSFTIEADSGLTINSKSNTDNDINYQILARENATQGEHQRVKIVITTSDGRVENRTVEFEVNSSTKVR